MILGRSSLVAAGPFLCLLLLSCSNSTSPSGDESRQLDSAEEMLNSADVELSNIQTGELEQPERNAP